ncbi:MAG: hypothetical protein JNK58_05100, partial [Phycisphaerae bacterium]|nr:hypothetical protein [Phycisphaerae bacterium]
MKVLMYVCIAIVLVVSNVRSFAQPTAPVTVQRVLSTNDVPLDDAGDPIEGFIFQKLNWPIVNSNGDVTFASYWIDDPESKSPVFHRALSFFDLSANESRTVWEYNNALPQPLNRIVNNCVDTLTDDGEIVFQDEINSTTLVVRHFATPSFA